MDEDVSFGLRTAPTVALALLACAVPAREGDGGPARDVWADVPNERPDERPEEQAEEQLVECEDYARRVPDEPRAARRHDATWASGRACLVGLPSAESVAWSFELEDGGPREVWLRYAARGSVRVTWRVDGGDWREVEVPPSGDLEGSDAWLFSLLGTPELSPGAHELELGGAPLRPDCFVIRTPAEGEPTLDMTEPPPLRHSPELLEHIAASWRTAPPVWLDEAAELTLPRWYEQGRVGLHTRLAHGWHDEPVFERAEAAAAELGALALVRHVRLMNARLFWPSEPAGSAADWVGPWTEAHGGTDPVAAMIERAHAEGLAFVAYYRHAEDRAHAKRHPERVCRDFRGRVVRRARQPRLCFHTPYADYVLARLVELAERGADGFYLDESHQPPEGCWCPATSRAFADATGLPMPDAPRLEDPLYRRFLAFAEDSLASELVRWRRALEEVRPGCVLLVSSHRRPTLLAPRPSARVAAAGHAVKTEYRMGIRWQLPELLEEVTGRAPSRDALLALGWCLARDAAFGRPPHVWTHDLDGPTARRAAALAVVAHGGYANLDHREAALPDAEGYAGAVAAARELGALLEGARPLRPVALHVPERARDQRLPDEEAAVREVIAPLVHAWEGLLDAHVPARLVSDDQLAAGLTGAPTLLFLPAPNDLTGEQRAAVEAVRAAGGRIVEGDTDELVRLAAELELPARVKAPPHVQVGWFRAPDGALLLTFTDAPTRALGSSPTPREVEGVRVHAAPDLVVRGIDGERLGDGTGPVGLAPFRDATLVRIAGE